MRDMLEKVLKEKESRRRQGNQILRSSEMRREYTPKKEIHHNLG